jgi:hypothetical protein
MLNIILSQIFPVSLLNTLNFHGHFPRTWTSTWTLSNLSWYYNMKYFFTTFVWPWYIIFKYNVLYHIIHTLHYIVSHCALRDSIMQWGVDFLSQHSTFIFSIRLVLDNDYGTIISFELVLLNISLNMNVLKIICTISKLAFKVLSLPWKCYKW